MSLIVVNTDGALVWHQGRPATLEFIDKTVGPEGHRKVHTDWGVVGWANDCALLFPERYPVNVIGSLLLATMGAPQQHYAGDLVITGVDAGGFPQDLDRHITTTIHVMHHDITVAAGVRDCVHLGATAPDWPEMIQRAAEHLRTPPDTTVTIMSAEQWFGSAPGGTVPGPRTEAS